MTTKAEFHLRRLRDYYKVRVLYTREVKWAWEPIREREYRVELYGLVDGRPVGWDAHPLDLPYLLRVVYDSVVQSFDSDDDIMMMEPDAVMMERF